ncbi:MAG: hypothetical protein COX20_07305 [Desulfobacterales bacterium CG23_combo_of_CG06-09_8_20_14_all_52_9]|nr:MAG: hypothetical protein COX20_07305 [Desulfobacterales bacterium CG23_combo_of_CG06-09_8_20_14_all_52_9]
MLWGDDQRRSWIFLSTISPLVPLLCKEGEGEVDLFFFYPTEPPLTKGRKIVGREIKKTVYLAFSPLKKGGRGNSYFMFS